TRAELGIPPVAVPVPSRDMERISDAETTMPAIAAVQDTSPISGPRGTRTLSRSAPPKEQAAPPRTGPQPVAAEPATHKQKPKRRRGRMIALLAVAVLLLGGLIGTGVWWFTGGAKNDTSSVPQLVGRNQA